MIKWEAMINAVTTYAPGSTNQRNFANAVFLPSAFACIFTILKSKEIKGENIYTRPFYLPIEPFHLLDLAYRVSATFAFTSLTNISQITNNTKIFVPLIAKTPLLIGGIHLTLYTLNWYNKNLEISNIQHKLCLLHSQILTIGYATLSAAAIWTLKTNKSDYLPPLLTKWIFTSGVIFGLLTIYLDYVHQDETSVLIHSLILISIKCLKTYIKHISILPGSVIAPAQAGLIFAYNIFNTYSTIFYIYFDNGSHA